MLSKKNTRKVIPLTIALLMTVIYYYISLRLELNSDMASALLESRDVATGNWLLKGWTLSTVSFFFTEVIWYAFAIKLFGYSYILAHIIPAIYLSILCVITVASCKKKKTGATFVLFFLATPTLPMAVNSLHTVAHIGTYIFCVISFLLAKIYFEKNTKILLIPLYIILSVTFFSDAISLYLFLIPVIFVLFSCYLTKRSLKDIKWLIIFAVSLLALATSLILKSLFAKNGFNIPGLYDIRLATGSEISKNIHDLFFGTLHLYNADFMGMEISNAIIILAPLSFICLVVFLTAFILKCIQIKDFDSVDFFLFAATLITPFAFIFTTVSQGEGSIRYIIPAFIFGTIFNSRLDYKCFIGFRITNIIFIIMIICSFSHLKDNLIKDRAENRAKLLSLVLSEKGFKNGFAEFWNASSISVYGQVQVSPVYYNDKIIIPMHWLSKDAWYEEDNRFVIINDEKMKSAALNMYGNPNDILKIAGFTIYVWDKNIQVAK
jgi:hypothetical protein